MTEHVTSGWDVLNTLVGNLPGLATAIGVIVVGWFSYKTNIQGRQNHDALNSRMSQLLAETHKRSYAEGLRQGVTDEQLRPGDPKKLAARVNEPEERLEQIRGQDQ